MTIELFVISYATRADADCEMDDPSIRDGSIEEALQQMASPSFVRVLLNLDPPSLSPVMSAAERDVAELYEDPPPDFRWSECSHVPASDGGGRESFTWMLYDTSDQTEVARMIAHKIEAA